MVLALWLYPILFVVGLLAGLVDSIAGGGGLIVLPILLSLGLPVPVALATNKFQSACGTMSATIHYARSGLVDFRACRVGIVATLIGASLGVLTVRRIDTYFLARAVPWLLAAILIYTMVRPAVGSEDRAPRMRPWIFYSTFGLVLGFYDGFFGPGVGSFWAIALVTLMGLNFSRATAHTKVLNVTSNLASLAVFAPAGLIHLHAGLALAAGQLVGTQIGSRLVVKRGARFIRPIFLTVVTLTLVRLIWVTYR